MISLDDIQSLTDFKRQHGEISEEDEKGEGSGCVDGEWEG